MASAKKRVTVSAYQVIYNDDGSIAAIRRVSDSASIPADWENCDFRAFAEWNAAQTKAIDLPDPPAIDTEPAPSAI